MISVTFENMMTGFTVYLYICVYVCSYTLFLRNIIIIGKNLEHVGNFKA